MWGLTRRMTTSSCVYALGAFAIHSLRFFLHFSQNGESLWEKSASDEQLIN